MTIKKKALLYDIANMAYMIADKGHDLTSETCHDLHRVRDICEEGNIDRVARVLGLAFSHILVALAPILEKQSLNLESDFSALPRNYPLEFSKAPEIKFALTDEIKLCIKETAHEYMVAMVLADWLSMTFPQAADVWKFRSEAAMEKLKETLSSMSDTSFPGAFRRRLSPF